MSEPPDKPPTRKRPWKIGALRLVSGGMILLGGIVAVGGCFAVEGNINRGNNWQEFVFSWGVCFAGLIARLLVGVWARLDDIAELLRERK